MAEIIVKNRQLALLERCCKKEYCCKTMFELYTYEAIYALHEAQKIAQYMGSQFIEPEHILLGLRREGVGSAARFLRTKKVSFEDIKKYFDHNSTAQLVITEIAPSHTSYEILSSVYAEAKKNNYSLIGQKDLFLTLIENSSSISTVLEKYNALPTEREIESLDCPDYGTDLQLPPPNPAIMQKLEAFNIFEMCCLHSAFIHTGAFRIILINAIDPFYKKELLNHLHQKYNFEGKLVVCEENQCAEPIRLIFGPADMRGWSWDEDQIEFNFVPEEFRDTRLKIAVLDFMSDIATLLNMPIPLADEGLEIVPWIVVSPHSSIKLPEKELKEEIDNNSHFDSYLQFKAKT